MDGHRLSPLDMSQPPIRKNFSDMTRFDPGVDFHPPGDLLQGEGKEIGHPFDPGQRENGLLRNFPAPLNLPLLHPEEGSLQQADIQLMARQEEEYEEEDMKGHPDGSPENFLNSIASPILPFLLRSEKFFLAHMGFPKVEGGGW